MLFFFPSSFSTRRLQKGFLNSTSFTHSISLYLCPYLFLLLTRQTTVKKHWKSSWGIGKKIFRSLYWGQNRAADGIYYLIGSFMLCVRALIHQHTHHRISYVVKKEMVGCCFCCFMILMTFFSVRGFVRTNVLVFLFH